MLFKAASGTIVLEDDSVKIIRPKITTEQLAELHKKVKPLEITKIKIDKPRWPVPGYIAFLNAEESRDRALVFLDFLEHNLTVHIEDKKSWREFEKFSKLIDSAIQSRGFIHLYHFNPLILPVTKVKRTSIPSGWNEIYEQILDIVATTNTEEYLQIISTFAGEVNGPSIVGFWRGEDRLWLEAIVPDNAIATEDKLREAGWNTPNDETSNWTMEITWSAEEVQPIAKFITNTFKWCFGMNVEDFVVEKGNF